MDANLRRIAWARRLDVLDMICAAGTGHIGGDMSCMDILVCLYYRVMDTQRILRNAPDRDRLFLSKGHNAEALYAVLSDCGFFHKNLLNTYAKMDTALAQHPTRKVPGVEAATGSLGHGLALGVGTALGLKESVPDAHVYVLMGDGEQAEGSVWEAAMAAGKFGLTQLTAIVDRNRLQISGDTECVMPLDDLAAKYHAFGWHTVVCDGHDPDALTEALLMRDPARPVAVIAHTHKGYGCAVMQDQAGWHHSVPDALQAEEIRKDLMARMALCGR